MKKILRSGIPIQSLNHLGLKYREDKAMEKKVIFKVYRFEVREIEVEVNPFQERVHGYLVTGIIPFEKIIICLIENRKGSIAEIKSCRKIEMDGELATYITRATVLRLSEEFVVGIK